MLKTNAFSYINMMDRALDASFLRETVIAHNIANVDTPTYKRKDVQFQNILDTKLREHFARTKSIDKAVASLRPDEIRPLKYIDYPNFSYRIDKNNVDIDTENVELASEQLRYQTMSTSVNNDFGRLKTVIK